MKESVSVKDNPKKTESEQEQKKQKEEILNEIINQNIMMESQYSTKLFECLET